MAETLTLTIPRMFITSCLLAGILITISACRERGLTPEDLPTPAGIEASGTALALTRIAPPEGFNETVSFIAIDDGLAVLPAWHFEATLRFEGTFAGTTRPTSGSTSLRGWYYQIGQRRRVMLERSGELLQADTNSEVSLEGVRVVENTYLVRDNVCTEQNTEATRALADLRVSDLLGGIQRATPTGGSERINGEQVWQYLFNAEDLVRPPAMEAGTITNISGELWVSPERNAVIRYYVTLDVENATIFNSSAPLDGKLSILYDLLEIGTDPNITRPFGC